jgi:hypothetical protein
VPRVNHLYNYRTHIFAFCATTCQVPGSTPQELDNGPCQATRRLPNMKFGHNLQRNQVPEWAASYINYKGLKKLIKTAADTSKDGSAPDLAGKHRKS